MNGDILFFFGEYMDALPIYERLEELILGADSRGAVMERLSM